MNLPRIMPTLQTKQANASRPKRAAEGDTRQERQRIYNTQRWLKLRKEILMKQPLCQKCNSKLSEHVHHIDSFMNYAGNERLNVAYNSDNLQALCSECHSRMHENTAKIWQKRANLKKD
jgi:5-methylcytosine-specific restriction protein A